MGRKVLTREKKLEVAAFLKICNSKAEIARQANVSRCAVQNIAKKIAKREPLDNRPGQGRPRISTPADDRQLKILSNRQRTAGSRYLASQWSRLLNRQVSAPTVRRRLQSLGVNSYVGKRKSYRSRIQVRKRLKWCSEKLSWGIDKWKRVVWSDESQFELINRKNRFYVRRRRDEGNCTFNFQARAQGGGGRVNVWGCFTAAGPGPIAFYEGTLNANSYVNMIKKIIPRRLAGNFDLGAGEWYLQQDNATCHRAKTSMEWFTKKGIKLLDWPPVSADLNPVENLWSIVDQELIKLNLTTTDELKAAIETIWKNMDLSLCNKLIESLPNRVAAVLRAKGKNCSKY